MNRANIDEVLLALKELLSKWGIDPKYWILTGQYADRLQGYDVRVREGHLNVLVSSEKIPWESGDALEVHVPVGSAYEKDFNEFFDQTGFEFDLLPLSREEFGHNEELTILHSLPDGSSISLLTPTGELKRLEVILERSNPEGWGVDKGRRILGFVEEFVDVLRQKKEDAAADMFAAVANRFAYLKSDTGMEEGGSIRGVSAYGGVVRGVARIMFSPDESKFKQGDILITMMTSPKFTPIFSKAAAIVTNEGGLLCHAAITGRELKIPCIVGARIATTSLHDGDLIEVDADTGIVRILDR